MRTSVSERQARFLVVYAIVRDPLARYFARRAAPDAVEDLLSETMAVLWRRVEAIPVEAELPWCYGVAARVLSAHRRSGSRFDRLLERVAGRETPSALTELRLGADPALGDALAHLRPDDAEILRLWAWEDLATTEIAAVLGITPNAAAVRLHRAKERLRALLGADL